MIRNCVNCTTENLIVLKKSNVHCTAQRALISCTLWIQDASHAATECTHEKQCTVRLAYSIPCKMEMDIYIYGILGCWVVIGGHHFLGIWTLSASKFFWAQRMFLFRCQCIILLYYCYCSFPPISLYWFWITAAAAAAGWDGPSCAAAAWAAKLVFTENGQFLLIYA